jgi:hypothetical protein
MCARFKLIGTFLLLISFCGCDKLENLFKDDFPPSLLMFKQDISLEKLATLIDSDANRGQAFLFHIVLTTNLQMAQELATMTSAAYFHKYKNKEFNRSYFHQFTIYSFGFKPGHPYPAHKIKLDPKFKYVGGYFFAHLGSPKGEHRLKIPPDKNVVISITQKEGMILVNASGMDGIEAGLEQKMQGFLGKI